MLFLINVAKYVAVIVVSSIAGWIFTRFSLALAVGLVGGENLVKYYPFFWMLASFVISMILAAISFRFIGVSDPDEISHYEGSSIGNAINLHSITNGESSFKSRALIILIFIGAIEMYLNIF